MSETKPSLPIGLWVCLVIIVPGIFDPFPNVAMHVVKAKGVARKLAHRGGIIPLVASLLLALTTLVCTVVGKRVIGYVTPWVIRMGCLGIGHGASCIFPFGLAQQAIRLAGHS